MKNREPIWFDIAQGQLTGCELDLKLVEADCEQEFQRRNDPRRLNAKMHRNRLEANRRLDVREPHWSGVLDVLDLLPAARAFGVVARGEGGPK